MAAKFEIKKSKNGKQFHFQLKAANGQIILASEMYGDRKVANKGIASVRKNAENDKRYERKTAKNGQPYFVLRAMNGEIIGKSEMYAAARSVEKGIASVKKNAPDAKVIDLSA
jgi:uncharacterized protein